MHQHTFTNSTYTYTLGIAFGNVGGLPNLSDIGSTLTREKSVVVSRVYSLLAQLATGIIPV